MIGQRYLVRIFLVVMLCVAAVASVPQPTNAQFTTVITGISPAPPTCVYRSAANAAQRTITLTGTGFPFPRVTENLQFRRVDNGAESIHIGMEVSWQSATQVTLDINTIHGYLWPDEGALDLQVRMTTYDPTFPAGQR
jgi:hypothetical protein